MSVNPVSSVINAGAEKLGNVLMKNPKVCNFNKGIEANGISLGTYAFVAIISTCVLIPRLIIARDADERREIFTRDFLTVLTMLFAMKGLKGILSNAVSKKNGLILTSAEKNMKNLSPVQKFKEYFKPIGGTSALTSRQLASKYTYISDKNTFTNFLKYVDENGGNIQKALTVDKKNGRKLTDASKQVFGEKFENMSGKEIIASVASKSDEELAPILDVLSKNKNPLVVTAKRINAWLEAMALGIIAGFLGFGLPELNKVVTNYVHKDSLDTFEKSEFTLCPDVKLSRQEQEVFKNFM